MNTSTIDVNDVASMGVFGSVLEIQPPGQEQDEHDYEDYAADPGRCISIVMYPQLGRPPKTRSNRKIRSSSDITFSFVPEVQALCGLARAVGCGACASRFSPISPTFSAMSWRIS